MQDSFESVEETFDEDGIIRVEHVDNINGDLLYVRVLWSNKGDR
jgi:hypothetical protein